MLQRVKGIAFRRIPVRIAILLLISPFLLCSPLFAESPKLEEAKKSVLARAEKSGAMVGIAFRTLDGKEKWYSRADESFHAASTMKVPVLIELFHQAKEGKLELTDAIVVRNEFHSIVDGSAFKLDAADDSEPATHPGNTCLAPGL